MKLKMIFTLDDKWHDMRATLSPAFTTSKIKNMFEFIDDIGKKMVNFYFIKMKEDECKGMYFYKWQTLYKYDLINIILERGLVEVELKDAFTRYANDVIATSAFGLKVNSLHEPDNTFYKMGRKTTSFGGFQIVKLFLSFSFPRLMKVRYCYRL